MQHPTKDQLLLLEMCLETVSLMLAQSILASTWHLAADQLDRRA
jgi:hypothetical protein